MAAELRGESAGSPNMGLHHLREAQLLSLGDGNASLGSPTRRIRKLVESARAPAEIREGMDSRRRLNILRLSDLSLACVSSGLKS